MVVVVHLSLCENYGDNSPHAQMLHHSASIQIFDQGERSVSRLKYTDRVVVTDFRQRLPSENDALYAEDPQTSS